LVLTDRRVDVCAVGARVTPNAGLTLADRSVSAAVRAHDAAHAFAVGLTDGRCGAAVVVVEALDAFGAVEIAEGVVARDALAVGVTGFMALVIALAHFASAAVAVDEALLALALLQVADGVGQRAVVVAGAL